MMIMVGRSSQVPSFYASSVKWTGCETFSKSRREQHSISSSAGPPFTTAIDGSFDYFGSKEPATTTIVVVVVIFDAQQDRLHYQVPVPSLSRIIDYVSASVTFCYNCDLLVLHPYWKDTDSSHTTSCDIGNPCEFHWMRKCLRSWHVNVHELTTIHQSFRLLMP